MRAEGLDMLLAIANDLVAANCTVTVAVCPDARNVVSGACRVIETSDVSPEDFVAMTLRDHTFDAVIPVAPESENILPSLVATFRRHNQYVISPDKERLNSFSDKWLTHQFLQAQGLPCLPTALAENYAELSLPEDAICVLKPRDGAGGDGIKRLEVHEVADRLRSGNLSATSHVVQPWIAGRSMSIGFIGTRDGDQSFTLPIADQKVEWIDDCPVYRGGVVSPELNTSVTRAVATVCDRFREAVGPMPGYVGVDLLMADNGSLPYILEVNPRFCSSYVGYRQATSANLMSVLLSQESSVDWLPGATAFRCG